MARKDIRSEQGNSRKVCQPSVSHGNIEEEIREIAQSLYEKRGRVPGHELDDWLEAERMVKNELHCRR